MDPIDEVGGIDGAMRERLRFLSDAHGLTEVKRKNLVRDGSRAETTAEHCWHLVLCATVLAPVAAPDVDLARVLQMLAVHDMPELLVGDTPAYEPELRLLAAERERDAATVVFGAMPESAALQELWREFDEASTSEARFAHAIDRLQPILVHWAGGGGAWRARGQVRSTVDGFAQIVASHCPALGPLVASLVEHATRRGDLIDDRVE